MALVYVGVSTDGEGKEGKVGSELRGAGKKRQKCKKTKVLSLETSQEPLPQTQPQHTFITQFSYLAPATHLSPIQV